MRPSRWTFLHAAVIAAALAARGIPCTAGEVWPTRSVTMVVTYAAGGTADPIARVLAAGLSQVLGQPVIVENVGGSGGMTGASRVVKAAPDGYQFVFGSAGTFAHSQTLYKRPLYNTMTDFAPVALVSEQPILLVARKDLPVRNLQEFIAYAKANQGSMQYGSPGLGSGNQLGCALVNAAIGINITHVPYRGGGPAMQDLVAGRTDYQCANNVLATPLIASGAIKAIAVLGRERSPDLPDLATAQEQGLAEVDVSNWYAIALPPAAPVAIVRKLNAATIAAMDSPAVREHMAKIGGVLVAPDRRSPEYLQAFLASEIARWAKVIKASGVGAD
jgi:tripartite-type tricarboxylate transporter receptor subunit TctC